MTEWTFTAINVGVLIVVLVHLHVTQRQIRGARGPMGPVGPAGPMGPAATVQCPSCKQRLKVAVLPHESTE